MHNGRLKQLFCLTTRAKGKIRKIVSCYFHARQCKTGGCPCTITAITTRKNCTYCEAIKIAKEKKNEKTKLV